MAREADLIDDTYASDWYVYQLKRFEALVRADEREIAIKDFKHRLATAIDAMPFGDTAASFAVYIRDFK
jgi:hypothetical protein